MSDDYLVGLAMVSLAGTLFAAGVILWDRWFPPKVSPTGTRKRGSGRA